jgi:hypothetical protein
LLHAICHLAITPTLTPIPSLRCRHGRNDGGQESLYELHSAGCVASCHLRTMTNYEIAAADDGFFSSMEATIPFGEISTPPFLGHSRFLKIEVFRCGNE